MTRHSGALRLDGKPALIFASHLANWELPALAAVAQGLDAAILYRRPSIASADRIIQDMSAAKMGQCDEVERNDPSNSSARKFFRTEIREVFVMTTPEVTKRNVNSGQPEASCGGKNQSIGTKSQDLRPDRRNLRSLSATVKPVRWS